MQGDTVPRFESQAAEQRGHLVHPVVQLPVGDGHIRLRFLLGHEDECRLAPVLLQVPVHAVVARVDLAADEPFPERRVAGVEHGVIGLEPGQHVRIGLEAVGEAVEAELLEHARVPHVRLCLELLRRLIVLLFLPVHGDLGFADLG